MRSIGVLRKERRPEGRLCHPGYKQASSPRVYSDSEARRSSLVRLPLKGGVRNDGRFAASAAPPAVERSSWLRTPEQVHGRVCPRGSHDPAGPNNPRDRRRRSQPPAFRTRMDFAVCCMSPGIAPFVDAAAVGDLRRLAERVEGIDRGARIRAGALDGIAEAVTN